MHIPAESWDAVSAVLVAIVGTAGVVVAARLQRTGRASAASAAEAANASREAARLSEPTGNGFAGDVRGALTRIESSSQRTTTQLDELTTHVHRLGEQFAEHLDGHAPRARRRTAS